MNQAYAQNAYRNNQILTAPQNKLVVMLYDGIIKNLNISKLALETKDNANVNEHLIKAQDIIMELMTTLNFEAGGEVAKNLYQMYDYMYFKLVRANIDKDIEGIDEILKYSEELRSVWAQI